MLVNEKFYESFGQEDGRSAFEWDIVLKKSAFDLAFPIPLSLTRNSDPKN